MAITRSYSSPFEVIDYTQELILVPDTFHLLGDDRLFKDESYSQNTVSFEVRESSFTLIEDRVRGTRPQANADDLRSIKAYHIPHFPNVDAIYPSDVQGKRAYGSDRPETEAAVMARKIERMRKSYDQTLELARWKTLSTGRAYAPNNTIAADFYADMGVARQNFSFSFNNATADIAGEVEAVIAYLQDTAYNGDQITEVRAYCSPEFFNGLIKHPKVQMAYTYYASTSKGQEIQRFRAGQDGRRLNLHRYFEYQGVLFIEVRNQIKGERVVPSGEAIFVPSGIEDAFVTYYGPANRFGYENTIAERFYMWAFRDPRLTEITIEAESNFINVLRRPDLVVGGVIAP